jgi:hypothetical protein
VKRALFICLLIAGCRSEEGARCQVNADCAEPLVCNQAKNVCTEGTLGGIDADVPDGPPVDAAIDAPDATP